MYCSRWVELRGPGRRSTDKKSEGLSSVQITKNKSHEPRLDTGYLQPPVGLWAADKHLGALDDHIPTWRNGHSVLGSETDIVCVPKANSNSPLSTPSL